MFPPGPTRSGAAAATPLAGPVTPIWNASNSLRAAEIAAVASLRAAVAGRIFSVADAVQTWTARAGGAASARTAAMTSGLRAFKREAPRIPGAPTQPRPPLPGHLVHAEICHGSLGLHHRRGGERPVR